MASQGMECLKLSEEQIKVLEDSFKGCKYPDETTLMLVAAECGLSEEDTLVSNNLIFQFPLSLLLSVRWKYIVLDSPGPGL